MMRSDWAWLAASLLQVLGLAVALTAGGFAYERSIRERISLRCAYERSRLIGWLALGALLLAAGVAVSEASWLQKGCAFGLALSLAWLAWPRRD